MPTWGELLVELKALNASGQVPPNTSAFDIVRRKYLAALRARTGRSAILYATKWTQLPVQEPELVSITPEDVQGFMEVVHSLPADAGLDLILHSPGGSAEAAEALVTYIRSRFTDVRVIVPHAAMSAATMLTCSANRICMGDHSSLGPIDPQFILQTEVGRAAVPAHAIVEQFQLAKQECKDPSLLPSWLPMLRQYGPALIVQCQLAQKLSEELVGQWLETYMFANVVDRHAKATAVAAALSNHAQFKSHGRFVSRDHAKRLGLVVDDLEADADVQDLVLSVFHATTHTFMGTAALKIIENDVGKAFIKVAQVARIQMQPMPMPTPAPQPAAP